MPSNHLILCHPLLFLPSICLQSFPMSQFFESGGKSIGVSASASVLPMNIQDWFPLGWTGWISLQPQAAQESFPMSPFIISGGQSIGVSASTSVLPMNTQDWFPLGWTGWISLHSKGLSRVFSNTTVQKHQFFLYNPTLTSIHDYWKNHSFDSKGLCQQSDVSAF